MEYRWAVCVLWFPPPIQIWQPLSKQLSSISVKTKHNNGIGLSGTYVYPNDIECVRCSNSDIRKFAEESKEIGIQYVGLCCGNCSQYFRELAEAFGRKPAASRFSTEISTSHLLGAPSGHVYSRADLIRQFMYGTTDK